MERVCQACGYVHTEATGGELEACPRCDRIYSRVAQARRARDELLDKLARGRAKAEAKAEAQAQKQAVATAGKPAAPVRTAADQRLSDQVIGWLMVILFGVIIYGSMGGGEKSPSPSRLESNAVFPCRQAIQRQANWGHEWTDSMMRPVFLRSRVMPNGNTVYTGNELRFQNGFGAWRQMTYTCEYDHSGDRVIAVEVF